MWAILYVVYLMADGAFLSNADVASSSNADIALAFGTEVDMRRILLPSGGHATRRTMGNGARDARRAVARVARAIDLRDEGHPLLIEEEEFGDTNDIVEHNDDNGAPFTTTTAEHEFPYDSTRRALTYHGKAMKVKIHSLIDWRP